MYYNTWDLCCQLVFNSIAILESLLKEKPSIVSIATIEGRL